MRKLFKGRNYSRAETIRGNTVYAMEGVKLAYEDPKPRQLWNLDVATSMMAFFKLLAFLDLKLHGLQIATSISQN